MSAFCLGILNDEHSMNEINDTNIVFIPKQKDPCDMSHFRPISLYNVLYKIVSKALVN